MTQNKKTRIILFDDDPTMRSLLETLLAFEGFDAVSYIETTPEEFIQFLINEHPSAILLDVHLTYSSGLDLLVKIKEYKELDDIFVLMTSGMDLKTECLNKGADAFLLKPYMPDELISWLHQHLD